MVSGAQKNSKKGNTSEYLRLFQHLFYFVNSVSSIVFTGSFGVTVYKQHIHFLDVNETAAKMDDGFWGAEEQHGETYSKYLRTQPFHDLSFIEKSIQLLFPVDLEGSLYI